MKAMRRFSISSSLGALAVLAAVGCGYSLPKEDDWAQIQQGMPKAQVVEILGEPFMVQGSDVGENKEDLYIYSDTTRYEPGERYAYYAVVFRNGEMVEKHRYLTKLPPQEVLALVNQSRLRAREDALKRLKNEPTTEQSRAEPGSAEEHVSEPRAAPEQPASAPMPGEERSKTPKHGD
jgi:outer membrane protein assembly factor BamE (lipoprotein component of BamABCDE complex)